MTRTEHIRNLLELYYRGESTSSQAEEITEFFRQTADTEIPDDLLADRQLFLAIAEDNNSAIAIPDGLEERLSAHIDLLERRAETASTHRVRRRAILVRRFAAVAASVAIMIIAVTAALMSQRDTTAFAPATAEMRHVTDIDEAARCLHLTDRLLAKGFGKAQSACIDTETRINNINNKILNLLNRNIQ